MIPDLDSFAPRLRGLNARLGAWQQQMGEAIRQEFQKLENAGALHHAQQQQEAARIAMARVGEGPRRELNGAIDELCALYLRSDEAGRSAIRELVHEQLYIVHDLWGYIRRAAENVRNGGGMEWLRLGLAVVALEDLLGDYTDTVEGLAELYDSARSANLDVAAAFREVGHLANPQPQPGRDRSTRDLLLTFNPAAALAHSAHGQR